MLKDYHPIEVVLGKDGSWAIEGVPDGHMGARRVFRFLLGQEPPENSYTTNPLWDWLYFPPGSLSAEQRARIVSMLAGTKAREEGSWIYKLHEVPHVDQPGQYTESFFDILKEPWVGRVVAGTVSLVLVGAGFYFWLTTREPGPARAGLSDVLAAAATPYEAPSFADRLAVKFTDGDRFSVPIAPADILHRGSDTIILSGFGSAFLVHSTGIGETVTNAFQFPDPALIFDTRGGLENMYVEKPDGSWGGVSILALATGAVEPGLSDQGIRHNDASTFQEGARYEFAGGIEQNGDSFVLFALPRIAPPYRVEVTTDDPALRSLLEYAATRNYTVSVIGELREVPDEETRVSTRRVGKVGPEIGVHVFRTMFVPGGGR